MLHRITSYNVCYTKLLRILLYHVVSGKVPSSALSTGYVPTVNGFTALAVNKLDVLSGVDELKVATAYRIDGKLTEDFPMTLAEIERAEPVYESA